MIGAGYLLEELSSEMAKQATAEAGVSEESPYCTYHQVQQVAEMAILRAWGLEPMHDQEQGE